MSIIEAQGKSQAHGEFLDTSCGRVFVMLHSADHQSRECVLVVPPFAEEMNKSRRLFTRCGQQLAGKGIAVAIPDLYGTGDSGGDFSDATWDTWFDNLSQTRKWIESQGFEVTGLLAIRLGALLACSAIQAGKLAPFQRSVFCQPVLDARRHLQQFLRLRVAASRMSGDSSETLGTLRSLLSSGTAIEVAGYAVSPALADDMEQCAVPEHLPGGLGDIDWIEIVRVGGAAISPLAQRFIALGTPEGAALRMHTVVGEPFWGTTEIVVDPELVAILSDCLAGQAIR